MTGQLRTMVKGIPYEVHVTNEGIFQTCVAEELVEGDTLADLKKMIEKSTKTARTSISIPAILYEDHWGRKLPTIRPIVLTGIHANRNFLARDVETGKSEQIKSTVIGYMTDEEIAHLLDLHRQKQVLAQEIDDIVASKRIDNGAVAMVRTALEQAIEEKS